MAYIKIFGIKFTVKKAVDYITNPDKTDAQNLVSSYGCSPETADLTFAMTAKLGKDNVMLEFSQNYPPKINLLSFIIHNF